MKGSRFGGDRFLKLRISRCRVWGYILKAEKSRNCEISFRLAQTFSQLEMQSEPKICENMHTRRQVLAWIWIRGYKSSRRAFEME